MSATQSPSGGSTPNSRFTSQAQSAEDQLKEQTLGLVHLSDFRKRRADAFEHSSSDGALEPGVKIASFKKKKKVTKTGGLSFGDDEDEATTESKATTPASTENVTATEDDSGMAVKRKMKPSSGVRIAPKSHSKSALARETQMKEALKKEYLQRQELVRATEFLLPFVFFDGKDTAGGKVRMKKGDQIWLFLERARKVGAELGKTNAARKDWARISVDDLMLVRQDLILPPHFDFHYLILNNTNGYHGPLFPLSAEPTTATPSKLESTDTPALTTASGPVVPSLPQYPDQDLEGFTDEPTLTRVVDRRWYEKNKHIYPASVWEDFDVQRDYSKGGRKDRDGNQMFFSR
ncbi:hypothetical protein AMS68_004633 [Peltaster fructicola]|uniref:FAM50A/XAP5 C-terminal domain-containing protein n=1 Tax=Peltaster fructicola TaxID=286661 RepID=A0A6H0XWQ7_9PEZI|nr:hypothetical protein AMS68_004633 [Peltaster fructicola]